MNYRDLIIWVNECKPDYIELFRDALIEWLVDYNLEWFDNLSTDAKKEIIRSGQNSGQPFPINLNSMTIVELIKIEDTNALDETFLDYLKESPIQLTKLFNEFQKWKENLTLEQAMAVNQKY